MTLSLSLSLSLTLTRWALRGNFWFHQIKAAEMPLCMDDELLRRGAHTRHMSAI